MQEVFWQMDKDKNGEIDPKELRDCLVKAGIPVPSEAEFKAMFDASDLNKSGHIDYAEFVATMLDSDRVAK
jgi:calcium-dependent protein kinase